MKLELSVTTRARLDAAGLLLLRVATGSMLLSGHGLSKLEKYGELSTKFADPLGVGHALSLQMAIFGELVCSALVVVGFLTRLSAIPMLSTMLVAAFIVHGDDPFSRKEFALLYAAPILAIILMGPGPWSLDRWVVPWLRRKLGR